LLIVVFGVFGFIFRSLALIVRTLFVILRVLSLLVRAIGITLILVIIRIGRLGLRRRVLRIL
jgi:hypothetical protein